MASTNDMSHNMILNVKRIWILHKYYETPELNLPSRFEQHCNHTVLFGQHWWKDYGFMHNHTLDLKVFTPA